MSDLAYRLYLQQRALARPIRGAGFVSPGDSESITQRCHDWHASCARDLGARLIAGESSKT